MTLTVGNQLRMMRKDLGLTLKMAGRRAGLSPARISQMEKGPEPGIKSIRKLCQGYGYRLVLVFEPGE